MTYLEGMLISYLNGTNIWRLPFKTILYFILLDMTYFI